MSTDPNINPSTTHTYDPLGRLLATLDAASGSAGYGYDVNDRLKQVTDPNGVSTQYVHDDLGNLLLLQEVSPARGTLIYTHDAAGNLQTQTDARGITATYTYDALNRLTGMDYPGTDEDVTFIYDNVSGCTFGVGRLCKTIDASGTTDSAYDAFGNLTQEAHTELGVVYTVQYAYDAGNRIQSMTYPDGQTVSYSRDGVGRISGVNMPINGSATSIVSNMTYRSDGLLTGSTFGNGLAEVRNYDLQGRLTDQTLGSTENRTYTYDANGNILTRVSSVGNATYTYDALNRLTAEGLASETISYAYDANGNRLNVQTSLATGVACCRAETDRRQMGSRHRANRDGVAPQPISRAISRPVRLSASLLHTPQSGKVVYSRGGEMGRTNIDLDDRLVAEGLKLTRSKTKRDLVDLALRELVSKRRRKRLLALAGKVGWRGELSAMRKRRV